MRDGISRVEARENGCAGSWRYASRRRGRGGCGRVVRAGVCVASDGFGGCTRELRFWGIGRLRQRREVSWETPTCAGSIADCSYINHSFDYLQFELQRRLEKKTRGFFSPHASTETKTTTFSAASSVVTLKKYRAGFQPCFVLEGYLGPAPSWYRAGLRPLAGAVNLGLITLESWPAKKHVNAVFSTLFQQLAWEISEGRCRGRVAAGSAGRTQWRRRASGAGGRGAPW